MAAIQYHEQDVKSQDIIQYNCDCGPLKEEGHIHLGRLEGE